MAHEGVTEYELIDVADDAAHTLALTVLRSTGMLSRLGMAYRPFPAGPMTPVEGLQMRGKKITFRYALAVDCDDPYALADDVLLPLETVSSLGGGTRPASGHELAVHGAQVSALHRVAGVLEVRVFNPTPDVAVVSFAGRSGWLVDLRGYPLRPFEATIRARPLRHRHGSPPRLTLLGPGLLALSSRSPTPRSSSRSRSTSDRRSQRTLRRRSAAAPAPSASVARPTAPPQLDPPQVLEQTGPQRLCGVLDRAPPASSARVELVRHEHGARVADVHNPVGQVDRRPEVVAVAGQHRPAGQAHPDVGEEVVVGVGVGQVEPDAGGVGHRVGHEHDLVADHLDHPAPGRGDDVVGDLLESADHRSQLLVTQMLAERA